MAVCSLVGVPDVQPVRRNSPAIADSVRAHGLYLELTRLGRGLDCTCRSPAKVSAGTEFLRMYDLSPGDHLVLDVSIGEHGYPQGGADASIVSLT